MFVGPAIIRSNDIPVPNLFEIVQTPLFLKLFAFENNAGSQVDNRPVAMAASMKEVQARLWGLFRMAFFLGSELLKMRLSRPII
jgi:hypothetical protein